MWALEEIFKCEAWCDTADAISQHQVEALGTKRPDFVCTFPDGTFGIFEAKGTTQSYGTSNSQAEGGKQQTAKIVPTNGQVSVRCCCAVSIQKEAANQRTRLLLLDPPQAENALPVALSRDKIIERTAMRRFREKPFGEIQTLFRGPQGITGTAREMTLTRKPYLQEKKHGWLDIETP